MDGFLLSERRNEMKICCGQEVVFNGSCEICFNCLKIYQHSNQEVVEELERRTNAEKYLPEVPD